MPLPDDRKPFLIQSSFSTRQGRFSPDGRWLAYVSDESGKDEVYVEGFPGRENKLEVSSSGGTNLDGAAMAANCSISRPPDN